MKRHNFLRCYVEAWLLWLFGNVFIGWVRYFTAKFEREPAARPFGFVEDLADPGFLIANALLVMLFAAFLVGHRRQMSATQ